MRTESLLLLLVYLACSSGKKYLNKEIEKSQGCLEAKRCSVKNYSLLDVESESDLYCPGEADPKHFTECCGPSWNRWHETDHMTRARPIKYDFVDNVAHQKDLTGVSETSMMMIGRISLMMMTGMNSK